MTPHNKSGDTDCPPYSFFRLLTCKWLGQEGNDHQFVNAPPRHLMSGFCHRKAVSNPAFTQTSRAPGVSSQRTFADDLLLHPLLQVDGPVDDVKEDVRSGKHHPGVLVYGVRVYPNVHIASGWLHLACNLRVVQRHLGQHSLLAPAVLWHPIIPRGVHIHRPVASDLGVYYHLIGVANAACTRQLQK